MSWSQARDKHVPTLTAMRRDGAGMVRRQGGLGTLLDFILREMKRHEESSEMLGFQNVKRKTDIHTCVHRHVN